jgi:hypothetical protein
MEISDFEANPGKSSRNCDFVSCVRAGRHIRPSGGWIMLNPSIVFVIQNNRSHKSAHSQLKDFITTSLLAMGHGIWTLLDFVFLIGRAMLMRGNSC